MKIVNKGPRTYMWKGVEVRPKQEADLDITVKEIEKNGFWWAVPVEEVVKKNKKIVGGD